VEGAASEAAPMAGSMRPMKAARAAKQGEALPSEAMKPAAADDGSTMELADASQAAREALYAADAAIPDVCGGAPGTLRHALTRLNSSTMLGACDSAARLSMKLCGAPAGKRHVEWLWLALLSRPPRDDELREMTAWLAANQGKRKALADLAWAVLNSQEFSTNH